MPFCKSPSIPLAPRFRPDPLPLSRAKYMGSTAISVPRGRDVVVDGVRRVKNEDNKPVKVFIVVTTSEVKVRVT